MANATFNLTNKLNLVTDFLKSQSYPTSHIIDLCNEVEQRVVSDESNDCDNTSLKEYIVRVYSQEFFNQMMAEVPTSMYYVDPTYTTTKEKALLETICEFYEPEDMEGYTDSLNASEKGVISSLLKKDLVFDASDYDDSNGNWKPTEKGLTMHNLTK